MSSFLPSSPTSINTDTTDSYPESPLPPSSPQDLAYTSPRSSGKKRLIRPSTPPRTSSRHATWVIPDVPNKLLPTRTLRRKQKRSSLRLVETSPQSTNQPISIMSSPVKTSPPTALDRNFGSSENSLAAPSLPMPGLSGRANSSTGNAKQATCLRDPLTTTESSRAPPSSLVSNLTLRPKSTSPPASEVTSSWGFTRCGFHKQPGVPASHDNDNDNIKGNKNHDDALITGLFFLGGEKSDNGSEFQFGNVRVHLQTSSQGFIIGAGRESVSILRITLRFTVDFMDEKDFGLDWGFESIKKKKEQDATQGKRETDHGEQGMKHGDGGGKGQQEHSLSLSLTVTITIMAINSPSLS
ncbi:hypothetical protein F5B22DRAFT_509358 [Xylaria bambusicola]|uniref:uncharacterized protein n=1 Tax=Xylaria bambusicola TaxID=326684 RepID=UPI002008D302|nr:uncharacterized protein F5B22DRAFT_509358 [Xylaria bambusicola]KAI0521900.1 hypothetical protein F5B22DRAFT_509358 [Xylaria bambusicola]